MKINKDISILLLVLTCTFSLIICVFCSSEGYEIECVHQQLKAEGHVSFLVVGDWGRRGLYNQSQVALQMGIVGEKLDIDFVISTGDNFYDDGLTGVDDIAFFESFSNIYTAPSLQTRWFNVLGNHDYRGDVLAQLNPMLRNKDNRFVCMRTYRVDAVIVEIVFVDTTPFVDKYFTDPKDHTYDWRGVLPRDKYLSHVLQYVESALKHSKSTWKIVVGHHTIKSAGHHGNTLELESKLLPILEANNVDAYINGHDHCLEHIIDTKSQIHFLTSGGGSEAWRGDVKPWDPKELKLYYDGQGFMYVKMNEKIANFSFYDIFGNVLHEWTLSKKSASSAEFLSQVAK